MYPKTFDDTSDENEFNIILVDPSNFEGHHNKTHSKKRSKSPHIDNQYHFQQSENEHHKKHSSKKSYERNRNFDHQSNRIKQDKQKL